MLTSALNSQNLISLVNVALIPEISSQHFMFSLAEFLTLNKKMIVYWASYCRLIIELILTIIVKSLYPIIMIITSFCHNISVLFF